MTNKKRKRYIIVYTIDQFFIIAIIFGIIAFLSNQQISIITPVAHEFIQFFSLSLVVLVCIIAFLINLIFIIKLLTKFNSNTEIKTVHPLFSFAVELSTVLIIVFISLLTIAYSSGTGNPMYDKFNLSSNSKFNELQEDNGFNLAVDFDYQKNPFGKIVGLHERNLISEDLNDINYSFYYRKSDLNFIYNKFEKYSDDYLNSDSDDCKIIYNEQYTLYIEDNIDEYTSYMLIIENETEYYASEFWRTGNLTSSNFSVEDFIKDSLYNYEMAVNG